MKLRLSVLTGRKSHGNRLQQRGAGKRLEKHRDGLRALHQFARGLIDVAGDHYDGQMASRSGQALAKLHSVHLGKMYINHEAGVGFRKFDVEDRARPVKGHNLKSSGEHHSAQCAENR